MYRNIEACANQLAGGINLLTGERYPKCFFKLPFIRASGSICNWVESGEGARYGRELQNRISNEKGNACAFEFEIDKEGGGAFPGNSGLPPPGR
jgi:hypothetical protein